MALRLFLVLLFAVSVTAQRSWFESSIYNRFQRRCRYAVCHVNGDPHYSSFDHLSFDWQGICKYNLASYCGPCGYLPGFRIFSKNEYRWGNVVSYPQYVEIHFAGDIIVLGHSPWLIHVNGMAQPSNYFANPAYTVSLSWGILYFEALTAPLLVSFDRWFSIIVLAGIQYSGKLCGLCGNFDGYPRNDWTMSNNYLARTGAQLGDGWVISDPDTCRGYPCPPRRRFFSDYIPRLAVRPEDEEACRTLVDEKGDLGPLVQATAAEDRELALSQCTLDAGYTNGSSVRYSIRHYALVASANCPDCQVDIDGVLKKLGFTCFGDEECNDDPTLPPDTDPETDPTADPGVDPAVDPVVDPVVDRSVRG